MAGPITRLMDPTQLVHPTAGGLACAVGAVVAGAPLFSDGLRSLRLMRHVAGLSERPLDADLTGFAHVSGKVALESPLFAPLSAAPCAGFQLEVRTVGVPMMKVVEERRAFRLVGHGASAWLDPAGGRWSLAATAEREVAADEPLSENLAALLSSVPEALWWRRGGGRLRLVERALRAGSSCHVVGSVRRRRPAEPAVEFELLRTGTDPVSEVVVGAAWPAAPELQLGAGEFLDFLLVSDRAPAARELSVPAWRALGVFAGPALSLLGLLYLAVAADRLRVLVHF